MSTLFDFPIIIYSLARVHFYGRLSLDFFFLFKLFAGRFTVCTQIQKKKKQALAFIF
jgi:hypothetical protein